MPSASDIQTLPAQGIPAQTETVQTPVAGEKFTAAHALLDTLRTWGVRHVFTCPGSTEAAFLTAAAAQDEIEILLTTHESVAVAMADGVGRETGRPGVAYLHANVGLTNGLSHLSAAQLAHSPVVLLTGLKQTAIQNRGGFTTAPHIRDFVRQYVKWDWQTLRPNALAEDTNRALRLAATEPQGPAWLGVAQDIAETEVIPGTPDASRYAISGRRRPARDELAAAAHLLTSAERVVIVAGAEVAPSGVSDLLTLAERLGAVVLAEDRRTAERSVVPADHPTYAGMYSATRECVQQADVLFFAGGRCVMEFEAPTTPDIPAHSALIHLHSDATEVGKIYGPDVALVGNAAETLRDLTELVPTEPGTRDPGFRTAARSEHQRLRAQTLDTPDTTPEGTLTATAVVRELAATLDENTTVVSDATTTGGPLLHAMELAPQARFHTTSSGSLGWGAGFALGVHLADPNRRVIAVLGDGVFQFGLPALWTAVRYSLPVVFVVVNNQAYAAVGAAIRRYSGGLTDRERELTVNLAGPDLATIARGFGAHAARITDPGHLTEQLAAAHTRTGPTVIEVMTDPLDLGP